MRIVKYDGVNICKFTQYCIQIYMYTLVFVILLCIDEKMNEGMLEMYQTVELKCVLPLTEIPSEFL